MNQAGKQPALQAQLPLAAGERIRQAEARQAEARQAEARRAVQEIVSELERDAVRSLEKVLVRRQNLLLQIAALEIGSPEHHALTRDLAATTTTITALLDELTAHTPPTKTGKAQPRPVAGTRDGQIRGSLNPGLNPG